MAKTNVIDRNGNVTAELELPAAFDAPVHEHLVYEAVVAQQTNLRRGTVSTKTRAEVSGSNRKPWRQKGTGRARAGATRSPLWRKGGTTFGPRPRDYDVRMPKTAKTEALRSVLAAKWAENKLLVVEDLKLGAAKTKEAAALLRGLKVGKALVVDVRANAALFTATRNLPGIKAVDWRTVHTRDVLAYTWLVMSRQAFESLVERWK
ncbi:MAG: 50S ribosomal protein L4 [Acidobacteriota bacterium]|nr:50S ribosomal protein L4 [Acidobacteriota bacterium]